MGKFCGDKTGFLKKTGFYLMKEMGSWEFINQSNSIWIYIDIIGELRNTRKWNDKWTLAIFFHELNINYFLMIK